METAVPRLEHLSGMCQEQQNPRKFLAPSEDCASIFMGTLSPKTSITSDLVNQRSGSKMSASENKDEAAPRKYRSLSTDKYICSNYPHNEMSKLDGSIHQAESGLLPSQQHDCAIQQVESSIQSYQTLSSMDRISTDSTVGLLPHQHPEKFGIRNDKSGSVPTFSATNDRAAIIIMNGTSEGKFEKF